MATTYLLRAASQHAKVAFGVLQRDFSYKSIASSTQRLIFAPATCAFFVSRSYSTSFVGRIPAEDLWAGVTSVSNSGRKRGRGRSVKKKVDLNRGQRFGEGKSGMRFPGLTGPALAGSQKLEIYQLKSKEDGEKEATKQMLKKQSRSIAPLERGYSGRKAPGTSIGPPDSINDYVFEGFDSKVLEYKMVSHMTGNLGRKMRVSTLVVTGNGKGLAGFAVAKAPMGRAALRKAKNMAAQRLQYFELYNGHTVFHDFAVKEHKTTIFVKKMPKGYGLHCHRVLETLCEVIGIEDLYCKVEGQTGNIQSLTKGFFRGLMEQETHQQLADRLELNVVEFRPELENIPLVVAAPSQGHSRLEPITEEAFEFDNMYYKDGRIPLKKMEDPLAEYKHQESSWKYFLKTHRDRNQERARYLRMILGLEPSATEKKQRSKPLK